MTNDEVRAFLLEGTRTGKLATTRADGRPHVAPIWFVLDGDDLVFTTHETSVKAQALLEGAPIAMAVDDQAQAFGRRNAVEGELLVRVTPTKVISRAEMTA